MDKVLDSLERLKNAPSFMGGTVEYQYCTDSKTPLIQDYEIVKQAVLELQSIKEANPSEALEDLEALEQDIKDRVILAEDRQLKLCAVIKQALLKAEQDKKKLNEIEKLTNLLYSERRKIGQEYIKWCEKNNTVFNDETNMITWVLAIKLKEVLKNE